MPTRAPLQSAPCRPAEAPVALGRSGWAARPSRLLVLGLLLQLAAPSAHASGPAPAAAPPGPSADGGDAADPAVDVGVAGAVDAPPPAPASPAEPDFSWMPASAGAAAHPLALGPLVGELRVDTAYHFSLARPQDNTLGGSSEAFRHGELQLTQLGFGGTLEHANVQARVMTQFGLYAQTTPRNDASVARGQWRLDDAYRFLAEAWGGIKLRHLRGVQGVNVQAGIFMSFIGLWSYYNFDNWTYQPSFVSSNTPWFFNGVRVQVLVNARLKLEPWLVNGWQAYGSFNRAPGMGLQVQWRPTEAVGVVGNQYVGTDTLGRPGRWRAHTDESVMVRYYHSGTSVLSRAAASLTLDAGCEWGDGATCRSQYFAGVMAYNRLWWHHDTVALTVGGGGILNPGRYLVLLPPINGANAVTGAAAFSAAPGDRFAAWDVQASVDVMPSPFVTLRAEVTHRWASVPYFAGRGGMTPPGGNVGAPGSAVPGWAPDLRRSEQRATLALLLKI